MNEKIYKTINQGGILGLTLGIVTLIIGVAIGVLLIIQGAKLLKSKSQLLI